MKIESLGLHSGNVVFWDLDEVDESKPLNSQIDHLKEDLAQISFPGGFVLDVGWLPSFNPQGAFTVWVVRDGDWESPLFQSKAEDIPSLKHQISLALLSIDESRRSGRA